MEKKSKAQPGKNRTPIVVVLGHVDHGKTTLLDNIRKSNVQLREAGGITQGIGASTVKIKLSEKENKKITFIDTPGHAVFSKMRSQGSKAADIAILVVAADDGVKPQTKEAISYIKDEKIPFVVAATKSDLPSANLEKVKAQLAKEGVILEGSGGEVPIISVSGKTGQGIDELLEMIILISEVGEVAIDKEDLEAVVIETTKGKKGPLVSVVVRGGSINVGDNISASGINAKVKGLFDENGKSISTISSGDPVQILGFSSLPEVGAVISAEESLADVKKEKLTHVTKDIEEGQISIILKVANSGSLDAIKVHLPKEVVVVSDGVGDVTAEDVFLAKSSNAIIFVFEARVSSQIKKLSKTEDVQIEEYKIVYKLFEKLDEMIKGEQKEILGKAKILAEFPFNKRRVAGSKVVEGRIAKSDSVFLERDGKEIGKTKISSMKKEKKDVDVVKQGEEFGLIFDPYLDFNVGDMVLSVRK